MATTQAEKQSSSIDYNVELKGQSVSIPQTRIFTASDNGNYLINVYQECTVPGIEGFLESDILWTDESGTQSISGTAAIQLNVANSYSSNAFPIRLAAGNSMYYSTTVKAASGNPNYSLFITVLKLT